MQAITTTYKGPTDHNGARVIAKCDAGRVVVSWDHGLDVADNHKRAADILIRKIGWDSEYRPLNWSTGSVQGGSCVHVCHYASETWRTGDFNA
jgi:hypothetical protein